MMPLAGNLNPQRYRDEILAREAVPFLTAHGSGLIRHQDNAKSHIARLTQMYCQSQNEEVLSPLYVTDTGYWYQVPTREM
jgi:hypothetical protein